MRRTVLIVIATALVTSVLTSVTVATATSVGKEGANQRTTSAPREQDGATVASLPVIVDTKVNCGTPPPGRDWPSQDALEKSIRCLEDEIINVNRFMKAFFRCARVVPVTQYGEDPAGGTHGYVYSFPDNTFFKTTALDFTIDPTTESFQWMVLWQNTDFCLG